MRDIPPQAKKALGTLNARGFEAHLVGGCVRDLLMGEVPKDWDIATSATPGEMQDVFACFKTFETGLQHGTILALVDGLPLEITTYRTDGDYSDNRHPDKVTFTRSLHEDLVRRDFTMNAIAMDSAGKVADSFGGIRDITAKTIRCVGEPDVRFGEDALRILRALRFSSVLGFGITESTSASIHKNKGLLRNISYERVLAELTKLLCGKDAPSVLREYADVVCVPIPEIEPMIGFDQRTKYHHLDIWEHTLETIRNSPSDPVSRWAALFHDIGKPQQFSADENGIGHFYGHAEASADIASKVMRRLRFDNKTCGTIKKLVSGHMVPLNLTKRSVKRLLNRYGSEGLRQLFALLRADRLSVAPEFSGRQHAEVDEAERLLEEIIAEAACFSLKDLAVNGHDLVALGMRGKQIGDTLRVLLDAVIEERVENEKGALLEAVKENLANPMAS